MPYAIRLGVYSHKCCGYPLDHNIHDRGYGVQDDISETFKSGFKPINAAFFEIKTVIMYFSYVDICVILSTEQLKSLL